MVFIVTSILVLDIHGKELLNFVKGKHVIFVFRFNETKQKIASHRGGGS